MSAGSCCRFVLAAVYRSPDTSGYVLDGLLPVAATIGVTTADFHSGPVGRWDRRQSLAVRLVRGTLSSADELQVLNGANPLLVQNADGEWELLQYATATPTGARSYTLTNLLRGQRGTEQAMRNPVAAGATVIVPNTAMRSTGISASMVGLPLNWRVGPADRDVGSPDFVEMSFTMLGKARRPLSPVHLKARWQSDGAIALSWIRRTRIGGDSWDQADVPLGEETERYEIEILSLDGSAVMRTVSVSEPAWTYSSANQIADFGAPLASIRYRVCQMSGTFGRGLMADYSSGA